MPAPGRRLETARAAPPPAAPRYRAAGRAPARRTPQTLLRAPRIPAGRDAEEIAFFTPPRGFDPATYYRNRFAALAGDRIYAVRLKIQADRAPYFQRKKYHPSQRIEPLEGGELEVTYEVAGLDEVRSFVQSWGVGVTVLAPPELVAMIAGEARELAKRYAGREDA